MGEQAVDHDPMMLLLRSHFGSSNLSRPALTPPFFQLAGMKDLAISWVLSAVFAFFLKSFSRVFEYTSNSDGDHLLLQLVGAVRAMTS